MLIVCPQAELAITCVYAFIFIILIVLCAIASGITRGHRLPYVCLLVSLVFSFIAAIAQIVRFVISSNGGAITPFSTITAMLAMVEFFGDWALPFLFLSFCLLLRVRFLINGASEGHARKLNPAWTIAYITISALLLIFGATATGLYTNYYNALYSPNRGIGLAFGEFIRMINELLTVYKNVRYTYDAIWYSTVFIVGGLAIHTYKATHRSGVVDKVSFSVKYLHNRELICL